MRKALTSLSSLLTVMLAVCWGSTNAQNATLEIDTDGWGYEAYWQMTPVGNACGVGTLFAGGNTLVGCTGGGGQIAGPADPGAYANNVIVGPIALGLAPLSFSLHQQDDWGDGGTIYRFYVDGVLQATVTSLGVGGVTTVNLVAGTPGCTDEDAFNYNAAATVDDGSCLLASCDVDDATVPAPSVSDSYCYTNNDLVSYTYQADPGEEISLIVTGGTMENTWDYINFYDGPSNASTYLGSATGPVGGIYVESSTGFLTMEFEADGSGECTTLTGGTLVTWDVYCGAAFVGVAGCMDQDGLNYDPLATFDVGCIIPSCDVDDNTPPVPAESGSVCYENFDVLNYLYEADPGQQVTIVFTGGATEACCDDIFVYDGANNAAPLLGAFAGDMTGITATSTSGFLYFELIADLSISCGSGSVAGPLTWDIYCGFFGGIAGCTNGAALNFDPLATLDDGSCIVPGCITAPVNGSICYENTTGFGLLVTADVPGIFPVVEVVSGNVEAGFDDITFYDGVDNTGAVLAGPFEGDLAGITVAGTSDNIFIEITADGSISCGSGGRPPTVLNVYCGVGDTGPGCTDPGAFNYDGFASSDDGSCILPEPNNACGDAIAMACGDSEAGSTILSTDAEGLIGSACGSDGGIEGPGVWYVFNGTGDFVTISTCNNADFDTRLTIFEGPCGALSCVTGFDDGAGCAGFTSEGSFTSQAGTDYYIYVHGFGGQVGNFTLSIDCIPDPCEFVASPANDDCSTPDVLTDGIPYNSDLCCTNPEPIPTPNALTFNQTFGVWYAYDNTLGTYDGLSWDFLNNGPAGVSFVGVTMYEVTDVAAYLLDPCDPANLTALAGCGEFGGQCQTGAPIDMIATYYVFHVWTVTPLDCGTIDFTVQGEIYGCTDPSATVATYNPLATFDDGSCLYPGAPANDLCAGSIDVLCGSTTAGSTGGATAGDAPAACGPGGASGVWYHFVGTDNQLITAALCGSNIDATIAILEGPCGAQVCVDAEDDDLAGCGFFDQDDPTVTFLSTLGTDYYFYVGGFGGEAGTFSLDLSCEDIVLGCTNPNAFNYNALANTEDASCTYTWADACGGSYDICYANFDAFAYTYCSLNGALDAVTVTFGGGSVLEPGFDVINIYDGADNTGVLLFSGDGDISGQSFAGISGCVTIEIIADDIIDCADGQFVLGVNFDVACAPIVFGCMDVNATNYNAAANVDDDSCEYCGTTFEYCYGNNENTIFVLNAPVGEVVELDFLNGEFEAGFDNITVYDGPNTASPVLFTGDGDVSGLYFLSSGSAVTIQIVSEGSFSCADLGIGIGTNLQIAVGCGVAGCDISVACNYDPAVAFADCNLCDFSCTLEGCTYPTALNYNPAATVEDQSCAFPAGTCPADINGDLLINTGDLNLVLAAYGTSCP